MPREEEFRIGEFWLSRHASSPKWQRTWYDKGSRQTKRASLGPGTEDFPHAKIKLTEWYYEHIRPVNAKPDEIALQPFLDAYYHQYAEHKPRADRQKLALGHLEAFFAGKLVSEITAAEQERYIAFRKSRGISPGTISRELTVLRAALRRGYKRGELASTPFIMSAGQGKARQRRLSLQEMAALFNAAKSDHFVMFMMLATNTLARPEAILELRPFQIETDLRLIHLNPAGREQTKKHRPTVPITDTLLPWVTDIKTNYVVNYHGRQVRSIKKAFRLARAEAKLDQDVIPYTIRHTMATELRRRGVPAWEVAGMLGHKTGGTSEIYAKFDPSYLSLAAKAIDAYFRELQPLVNRPLIKREPMLTVIDGGKD